MESQWEKGYGPTPNPTPYVYPEEDLLRSLVFVFFEKFNSMFPLLHRPSFLKSLLAGDHLRDQSFGMVVLLVCALGARYSNDPRVILPGDARGLSSGWQFFSQIDINRFTLFTDSTLTDLQAYTVSELPRTLSGLFLPSSVSLRQCTLSGLQFPTIHIISSGLGYAVSSKRVDIVDGHFPRNLPQGKN